jgi:hypothetical protein
MSKSRPLKIANTMKYVITLPPSCDTSWYDSASPEEAAEALKLGATLHTTMRTMKAGEEVAALEAKQASAIAAIRAAADERIVVIQKELESAAAERSAAQQRAQALFETQRSEWLAASLSEKNSLLASHTTQLNTVKAELRVQEERYAALEARAEVYRTARDEDIRTAEQRTKALLQHALDEKERSIARADATLATLKEAYERQTEELRTLADLVRKKPSSNSRVKGTDYESEFRDKLVSTFGLGDGFKLEDSARSGIGHAGDYLMKWTEHTILWEVKNYEYAVPTKEVEKFRRDMKENPQVRVGVMISRLTAITGQVSHGDRNIEFVEGKMLIYLSNFESMSDDTLANLMLLFRVWWAQDHADNDDEDTSKIDAIRQIEKLYDEASKAKTEWRHHKSHMDTAIRWMAERVEDTESRLRAALNVLQGVVKSLDTSKEIFIEEIVGDAKKTEDAKTLLRISSVNPSSSCLLNDLAKLFATERNISIDTAKSRIRDVLQPSIIEAQKGKPIKILGLALISSIEHV